MSVPQPLLQSHVWVWTHWPPRGDPSPAVVLGWHLEPTRQFQSPWTLQIAVQRAPGSVVVDWVPEQRVTPVLDPSPGQPARKGVRHVWTKPISHLKSAPGLVVDWRRSEDEWQALVACVLGTSLLLDWHTADQLVPVADDTWGTPEVIKYKRG